MAIRSVETPHGRVSATFDGAEGRPVLVLAHGAGGTMRTAFLDGFAAGVAASGASCMRFNFAYSQAGRRSPDREPVLREVWSAAAEVGSTLGEPVWAGGKSMGGRVASMMAADGDLDVAGLVLVGYPLHPTGKPERLRDQHFDRIGIPMLFLQGTADAFARWDLLTGVLGRLGDRAVLHEVEGGDHSFRVRGRPKDDAGTGTALGEVAGRFVVGGGHPST
jgi:predicted alpha/beta-hydrolase family hydrolase